MSSVDVFNSRWAGLFFVIEIDMKLINSQRFLSIIVMPLLALSLSACGPKSPLADWFAASSHEPQDECGFVQNVYGERISWKDSVPVQLYLHQSFPQSLRPALDSAIQVWESRLGRRLFQVSDTNIIQGTAAPKQDGMNVIYLMNTWESDKSSEQARTSIYWLGNHIQEADIRLNDAYFNFYLETPTSSRDVHMESLLIHELGHVLGLKHKDSGDSVMATYLASLMVRDDIPTDDITNVKCEY